MHRSKSGNSSGGANRGRALQLQCHSLHRKAATGIGKAVGQRCSSSRSRSSSSSKLAGHSRRCRFGSRLHRAVPLLSASQPGTNLGGGGLWL